MTEKKSKATANERKETVVYCGPTIPGIANQYTFYTNGTPLELEKRAQEIPAIRGLLIPLDQLPETMKKLRGQYGHLYRLYRLVQATL